MKISEKILIFIQEHFSGIQVLMTCFVIFFAAISGVSKDATPLIIALLLFIGAEQYLNLLIYTKQLINDIADLKENSADLTFIQRASDFVFEEKIKLAKHSIFINGGTLESMFQHRALLNNIPEEIKLEIVYTDFDDATLLSSFKKMIGFEPSEDSLKRQYQQGQAFCKLIEKKRPSTIIKKVDYLMPIAYVAIDIHEIECNTFIRAKHYLNNSNDDAERLICIAKYDSNIFQLYKKQIDNLLSSAKPYTE